MVLLLGLHLIAALLLPFTSRWAGRRAFWLGAVAPAAAVGWLVAQAGGVLDGEAVSERLSWVRGLQLAVDLRLDAFGLLMALLVTGMGVLVLAYSVAYFGPRADGGRLAALLVAFGGSMLGLVLSDSLLVLYVFWELTSVTSYALIGIDDRDGTARAAARHALIVTAAGGLCMLAGFVVLARESGTFVLSELVARPPGGGAAAAGFGLVLLGAFTKSAQVPFHAWLPGAMAAPTPVSAYLHSATMVKAGVFLVARIAPAAAAAHAFWRPTLLSVGLATMLVAGWRALRERDLKLLLAYSTVSQLGFMMALLGAGTPALTAAGVAVLTAHAVFKAALFMVVGIVDHEAHTRDIAKLTGLARMMPATLAVAGIAVASMVGLPPLFGFVAKETAFDTLRHAPFEGGTVALVAVVVGSMLTVAYGARFLWGAFGNKSGDTIDTAAVHAPVPSFLAPAAVLAAISVAAGLATGVADELLGPAAAVLHPGSPEKELALWHGFTLELALSGLVLAVGVVAFLVRGGVARLQGRLTLPVDAAAVFEGAVVVVGRVADRVTAIVQNGSLPVYLGVILLTVLALPGAGLALGARAVSGVTFMESPLQLAACLAVVAAAVGVATVTRRFAAVLLLGAVGYSVAVLFLIQGAPDLALTQLLVESVLLVVFVLVLRHLPERFRGIRWRLGRASSVVIAAGVGFFVMSFALVAASSRVAPPVSVEHVERALPEGGGRNVVNVILTDFRALDTLGEIVVLTVAAFGIASLAFVRRGAGESGEETGEEGAR